MRVPFNEDGNKRVKMNVALWSVASTSSSTRLAVKLDFFDPAAAFEDRFNFFTGVDPTHGFVTYVNRTGAKALVGRNGSSVVIRAGHNDTAKRPLSVRIESRQLFEVGSLFVVDLDHVPVGCGTWPAFWLNGNGSWPATGEIDIIEGIGGEVQLLNSRVEISMHTKNQCIFRANKTDQTALPSGENCAWRQLWIRRRC